MEEIYYIDLLVSTKITTETFGILSRLSMNNLYPIANKK